MDSGSGSSSSTVVKNASRPQRACKPVNDPPQKIHHHEHPNTPKTSRLSDPLYGLSTGVTADRVLNKLWLSEIDFDKRSRA